MSDATRLAERVAVSWLDWDPLTFPDELLPRSPSCAAMAPTDILLLLLLVLFLSESAEGVRGPLRSSRLRSKML